MQRVIACSPIAVAWAVVLAFSPCMGGWSQEQPEELYPEDPTQPELPPEEEPEETPELPPEELPDGWSPEGQPVVGQLTAGDWDDNRNLPWFVSFLWAAQATFPELPPAPVTDRVLIRVVTEQGLPVSGAQVSVLQGETERLAAPSASDGRLLLFPSRDGADPSQDYTIIAWPPEDQPQLQPSRVHAPADATRVELVVQGAASLAPEALDLVFMIDTTGSMDDELSYLQAEVQDIVGQVSQLASGVSIRVASVLYQDHFDQYQTRVFGFTDDLNSFMQDLSDQTIGGGGDYEEMVERAFQELNFLEWRSGNVARVAFWIADAPSRDNELQTVLDEVGLARRAGIRLYPVAASGVRTKAEYLMRVAAQATLGRYIFLTDDSGIGSSHTEPHIPCFQIQYLNQIMIRMVHSVLAGEHIAPNPAEVIRSVGNPVDGVCAVPGYPDAYL